jgi:nitroreductase
MLDTETAIRQRRSVRAFLDQPVPQALQAQAFALAQCAPSNCNTQPWVAHVVSGSKLDALRAALHRAGMDPAQHRPDFAFDGRYPGIYRERQHDAAARLYAAMGVARDDKAARGAAALRNFLCFDAPHAVFAFLPEPFGVREAVDCGMWAQTLMLAFTAQGVASCPQAALSFHPDVVREHLGLAPSLRVLFGISFGYEDTAAPANACRVPRAALDAAVTWHG